jgi:cysteine desulfurase
MKRVYFDHAATTPTDPVIAKTVFGYMTEVFGNPGSVHSFGRQARQAVDVAREQVAQLINAQTVEIFFTSGGTEADNIALKGVAYANRNRGNHIITSAVEHHAVLEPCEQLKKEGFDVTVLPVDEYGRVSVETVKNAIKPETILISIMFANNEVGTIQPIAEIGALARERKIYFHTDAVQAVGNWPIDVKEMNIDLLTMSGHKFNAPKGIGALYVRKGVRLRSVQQGGGQERHLRPGTENVPGIVGLGMAAEKARLGMAEKVRYTTRLRDRLLSGILATVPEIKVNGHPTERLPGNVNVSVIYVEGESLLLNLDMKGIAASSGSACTSGSLDPSHVLLAMGLDHATAHGSLRLTLGDDNTEEDVDYFLAEFPAIVDRLRRMSPLYATRGTAVQRCDSASCKESECEIRGS